MFLKLACLYLATTCVSAAPSVDVLPLEKQQPTVIPIISQSGELEANGTYKYSYETANGIKREETSYDKVLPKTKSGPSSSEGGEESDESNEIHVQQGSYSYTAPDGTLISVRYIADENGFRPIGDHLPKPPPVVPVSLHGRRAKTINAESRSAAVEASIAAEAPQASEASQSPEIPKAPEAPQSPEAPKVAEVDQSPETPKSPDASQAPESPALESRLAESSAEKVSTTEVSSELSTTEVPSELSTTTEATVTDAAFSTEASSSTTEQATSAELTSTVVPEQPTTSEVTSTPEASSEPASTPTPEASTTQEQASTTASETSTAQEPSSTTAEEPSTPDAPTAATSEVTTEVAAAPSA